MDRYDREERRYDRGDEDRRGSEAEGAPSEFPWEDSGGEDQPSQVWEEPAAEQMGDPAGAGMAGLQEASGRNPLAIAGFILSLVMWIVAFVPYLSFVLWILALTFSSMGLSRARKLGAPHKGLAVAGLCISLIGVVLVVFFILFLAGVAVFSSV